MYVFLYILISNYFRIFKYWVDECFFKEYSILCGILGDGRLILWEKGEKNLV